MPPDAPRLLIRADAGPGIGGGHLGRTLALAQAWRDSSGEVVLASRDLEPSWRRRWTAEGADVINVTSDDVPAAFAADAVVVDGYQFQPDVQARWAAGRPLLVIDDHGLVTPTPTARLVLDQNPGALRPGAPRGVRVLLGSRYALLRRDVVELVDIPEGRRPGSSVLLLAPGSNPTAAVTSLFSATADDERLQKLSKTPLAGVDRTGPVIAASQLALAGAGTTTWELSALGVPSVLVALADNQRPVLREVVAAGAALDGGDLTSASPTRLATALAGLAADVDRRARMAAAGRKLVDGGGARRVATALRGELLRMRPATLDDARLLWEWANDPDTRRAAFNSAPIRWEEHLAWLEARLTSPSAAIGIAETLGREPLGHLRVEVDEHVEGVISLVVAPGCRGNGWAPSLIDAGCRWACKAGLEMRRFRARVRPENEASHRSFLAADFDRAPDDDAPGSSSSPAWRSYTRSVDD